MSTLPREPFDGFDEIEIESGGDDLSAEQILSEEFSVSPLQEGSFFPENNEAVIENAGESIEVVLDKLERYQYLAEAAVKGIFANRQCLVELGIIPDTIKTDDELKAWVTYPFLILALHRKNFREKEAFRRTNAYKDVVSRLVFAGVIKPITLGNWKIDRNAEVNQMLGITSLTDLQNATADFIGQEDEKMPFVTMHCGPGNCSQMETQREDHIKSGDPARMKRKEIGVGDKLYFNVEDILREYLLPEKKEDPYVEKFIYFLGQALRLKLNKIYYKHPGRGSSRISDFRQVVPFFDVNIIFKLLAKPSELLKDWQDFNSATVTVSGEFEGDTQVALERKMQRMFLRYLGFTQKHSVDDFKSEDKKSDPVQFLSGMFRSEFVAGVDNADFYEGAYFKNMLYPDRAGKIRAGLKPLDLNRQAKVYLNYFIPGKFTDIPEIIAKGQISNQNGIRAESHEKGARGNADILKDNDFYNDIAGNLDILRPGGVRILEGVRESHTRLYRFAEILAAVKDRADIKAEVVVDFNTYLPISVIIQKELPGKGFFSNKEKEQFINYSEVFTAPLLDYSQTPHILLINSIRAQILKIAGGREDVFRSLHDIIDKNLDAALLDVLFQHLPGKYGIEHPELLKERPDLSLAIEYIKKELKKVFFPNIPLAEIDDMSLERVMLEAIKTDAKREVLSNFHIGKVERKLRFAAWNVVRDTGYVDSEIDARLETFDKSRIYVFPRMNGGFDERVNLPNSINADFLPDNEFVLDDAFQRSLKEDVGFVRNNISKIKRDIVGKPIKLVDFTDCCTNDLLEEKLRIILGRKGFRLYVESLKVKFKPNLPPNHEVLMRYAQFIPDWSRFGAIIISGGSQYDAYDLSGKAYKDYFVGELIKFLAKEKSKLRVASICFSHQALSDAVGKMFYSNSIKTLPGLLEMGPTPISLNVEGQLHPIFKGMNSELTVAMTHSGHVFGMGGGHEFTGGGLVKPLAISKLTNLPVAYSGFNNRLFSMQFHPEIEMVSTQRGRNVSSSDIECIMKELVYANEENLKSNFGIDRRVIAQNWAQAARDNFGANEQPGRLKADVGLPILARTLRNFVESLL